MKSEGKSELTVNQTSKSFGGIQAVNKCSFTIKPGEICGLIGPNGAGKTTVLNLITGTLTLDEGKILLGNESLNGLPPYEIVSRGIARTFQDLRLFKQLTVLENVLYAQQKIRGENPIFSLLRMKGWEEQRKKNWEAGMECLRYVGLAEKGNEITSNLSYGEEKLLSLARVLATEAKLLLLDEPMSGLDSQSIKQFFQIIHNLNKEGKTVLLIEHNFSIIKEITNRVIFLHHGQVIAEGRPEEIIKDQKLTEIYFGGKR
jgi:ABC-type branched-subunit amino acid transport system ATPase component